MEGSDQELEVAGKGIPATPRWNPTKEQISILEGFYRDGVKTPNAEQIEEITRRLKEIGEIECKNVFYWFQNHKARIRQKQKQHNFQILNSFLLPPNQHVICNLGYYPNLILPDEIKKRARTEKYVKNSILGFGAGYGNVAHFRKKDQETLDLFPVHPTGILQDGRSNSNLCSSSDSSDVYLFN